MYQTSFPMYHSCCSSAWVRSFVSVLLVATIPLMAHAHFLFVIPPQSGEKEFSVVFGEGPEPDDPEYLKKFKEMKASIIGDNGETIVVDLVLRDDRLVGNIPNDVKPASIVVQGDWGMFQRDEKSFMLKYCASAICSDKGMTFKTSESLPEDARLSPQIGLSSIGKAYQVFVQLNKQPMATQEVRTIGSDAEKLTTDAQGLCVWTPKSSGLASLVTSATVDQTGEWNEESYKQIKRYSTLTIDIKNVSSTPEAIPTTSRLESSNLYPDMPLAVTSFGAAKAGNTIYVYGGHTGSAHDYWNESQSNELFRLNLDKVDEGWQQCSKGPRLQGLGLVAYKNKIIRLGGFAATNMKGGPQNLISSDSVAQLDLSGDLATTQWQDLPALPEPRSSLDAAILDDTLYVVGGWALNGETDRSWHNTAWKMVLNSEKLLWEPIANPPFQRRAAALCGYQNCLYVMGGMTGKGDPTTDVEVLDLKTNVWSKGPSLPGAGMSGFGAAAVVVNDRLVATTHDGKVARLSKDGKKWELLGETQKARFFHRIIAIDEHCFVSLGGASMSEGKFVTPELVQIKD